MAGRPKIPLPIMELITSAARPQRPMALTRCVGSRALTCPDSCETICDEITRNLPPTTFYCAARMRWLASSAGFAPTYATCLFVGAFLQAEIYSRECFGHKAGKRSWAVVSSRRLEEQRQTGRARRRWQCTACRPPDH